MTATIAETTAGPTVIERARAIVREVMTSPWPDSREAMASIGYARRCYQDAADAYDRLVNDEMTWDEFDGDLEIFDGDPQAAAIRIAADRCLDAARALLARLREHQQREDLAARLADGGES